MLVRGKAEESVLDTCRYDGVQGPSLKDAVMEMAGYRDRLDHFRDEVAASELNEVRTPRLDDVGGVRDALLDWLRRHPESVDGARPHAPAGDVRPAQWSTSTCAAMRRSRPAASCSSITTRCCSR